jgi:hypothetical protein
VSSRPSPNAAPVTSAAQLTNIAIEAFIPEFECCADGIVSKKYGDS